MLALYLVDRIISSFTVLISPMIVGLAIYLEAWLVAGAVPLWWLGTRAIKAAPYLRSRPLHLWMVPVYVLASFASGLIKIYALMTLNTQGWLTRGHTKASPPSFDPAQGVWGLALTWGALSALAIGDRWLTPWGGKYRPWDATWSGHPPHSELAPVADNRQSHGCLR